MLLIEAKNIEKSYGERVILQIDAIKIYLEDRIGIVGVNGSGKTTLVNILCNRLLPDKGYVKCHGIISYITQLEDIDDFELTNSVSSAFGIGSTWEDTMSGGEKTRFKIAQCFSKDSNILFGDEPSSNLDIEGVQLLEKRIKAYRGAVVLISHDRAMLDNLCNKIYEVDGGKLTVYIGNYSSYLTQKRENETRKQFEYDRYREEKLRLKNSMDKLVHRGNSMNKTPKRMGNSEARLHKLGNQRAEGNIDNAVNNIKSRLQQLEVKERPVITPKVKFYSPTGEGECECEELHKIILIEGRGINKTFDKNKIFTNSDFDIYNGAKTAIIGPNGSGKTTLLRMILARDEGINASEKLKIGYFSQALDILKEDETILENIMESSCYDETFGRSMLIRLLFKRGDINKRIEVLSGGEKVKVSLAKLLLQDNNMLVMDEPTNYLDINSLEAVEELFCDYDRTILMVSHDRKFISRIADRIISIENNRLVSFNGGYEEFLSSKEKRVDKMAIEISNRVSLLENKLSEIVGRLSMPTKRDNKELLEQEYIRVLNELKLLKNN